MKTDFVITAIFNIVMIGFHIPVYGVVDIFGLCKLPAAQFNIAFVTTTTTGVIIREVQVPLEGRNRYVAQAHFRRRGRLAVGARNAVSQIGVVFGVCGQHSWEEGEGWYRAAHDSHTGLDKSMIGDKKWFRFWVFNKREE